MRATDLQKKLDSIFSLWEADGPLSDYAKTLKEPFKPMHGNVMPRTYVGKDYGKTPYGVPVPKILMMAINQSKKGQEGLPHSQVRQSLYDTPFNSEGKVRPNGYGPRLLALNLARLILAHCGVDELGCANADQIHDLIAYDNFIKWPFNVDRSTPPKDTWLQFYAINREIVELLKPDIIVCLGAEPYKHVAEAMKEVNCETGKLEWTDGYDWTKGKEGWWGTLTTPWGHCPYGRVYHYGYSARVSANTNEALVQEYGPCGSPWWGAERSTNGTVAKYKSGLQSVASWVCQALAGAWLNRNDA